MRKILPLKLQHDHARQVEKKTDYPFHGAAECHSSFVLIEHVNTFAPPSCL